MQELKRRGIRSAIVTSSNDIKMSNAYAAHPELLEIVDTVLTSEHFSKSKPDPECFLKGMEVLGATPQETIVFEDSFHGISAGRASGAKVIGLATTNKREALTPLCDMVIDDFTQITVEDL
jgi:HAD superfamily hydrolase (TIGR01509 family)